jgi:hypothetical protein
VPIGHPAREGKLSREFLDRARIGQKMKTWIRVSREAPFGRLWHERDFSPVIYVGVFGHNDLFKLGHTIQDRLQRREAELRRELRAPGLELHVIRYFPLDTPVSQVMRHEKRLIADLRSRGLQFIRHCNTEVVVFPTTREMRFWKIGSGMSRLPPSVQREQDRRRRIFERALLTASEVKRRRASRSRRETILEYKRRMPDDITSRREQRDSEEARLQYLGGVRRKHEEQQLAALGPLGERPIEKPQLELDLGNGAKSR